MSATEPIRSKKDLNAIAGYYRERGEYRNYVLVVLGTHTVLRISDLLQLRWQDVYDEKSESFRVHVDLSEHKTGKDKQIALNEEAVAALREYYPLRKNEYIFASRSGEKPISRVQAYRIIRNACTELEIDGKIACHSLRKTWGYHAWTSGQVSPVVITEIYNHSSYEVTKRYLGVSQDDLDEAYRKMRLF